MSQDDETQDSSGQVEASSSGDQLLPQLVAHLREHRAKLIGHPGTEGGSGIRIRMVTPG